MWVTSSTGSLLNLSRVSEITVDRCQVGRVCNARWCDRGMGREMVTCCSCWTTVPADLREEVSLSWRKSCRWLSRRWCRAVGRAVRHAERVLELQAQGHTLAAAVELLEEMRQTSAAMAKECE